MDKIQVSERGSKGNLVSVEESVGGERQYLAVPYAEREAAKAAGAKWDWREKLWYIGPEGTRAGLAKWLPENAAAAAPARANPREEFAEVLRELGGDLTDEHPIMDGRPQRMATWTMIGAKNPCSTSPIPMAGRLAMRRTIALAKNSAGKPPQSQ